jgi:hypothetical protein
MARRRYVIRNMPLRGGLVTAGQHGSIPENMLWQAKNCTAGLDGLLQKRPGLWQWGQVLKQPAYTDDVSFYEMFETLDNWSESDAVDEIEFQAQNGKLVASISPGSGATETEVFGRKIQASQGDSDDADWSVRFTVVQSNMPADGYFIVSCKARTADDPYAFKINGDEVEYYATGGVWTSWYTFALSDAGATTFEIRLDADGNATLYVNEQLVATQAVSSMDTYDAFTEGDYTELHFETSSALTSQFTIYISDFMFDGTVTDPFAAERLGAGTDFKTVVGGNAVRRFLVVSGERYVYRDADLKKYWSPLLALTGGGSVAFSQFGDELLIFDGDEGFSSNVYRWDGVAAPELLDDAPNVRFGTEHRTRLFAAGDKQYPLRLYYTASRAPNVWFAPETDADGQETTDEVLDAGYIQVPGKRGDEIVAIQGEYYGSCIVCTNRGIWRITGSSPISFTIENVTQDTGAASFAGIERMGNDLWIAGRQGITTLGTVDQFGDMKAAMPSAPIADLWAPGVANSSIKVDQYQMFRCSLAWNPTLQIMLFAFARQGASDVSSIYAYNPTNQGWYGPWETDTTFVASVEVASPVVQAVMHGTDIGKVGITDPNLKADFDTAYTQTVESPYLSGRSLDPAFQHQIKTWKTLRLFLQNRGDWDLDVRWQVDDETYQTRTESQNMFNLARLGTDWRINVDPDGRIHSNQLIGCIEIPLDVRGRYFKFDISTADDIVGEDMVLQGYEVEFLVDGPDQEQE